MIKNSDNSGVKPDEVKQPEGMPAVSDERYCASCALKRLTDIIASPHTLDPELGRLGIGVFALLNEHPKTRDASPIST